MNSQNQESLIACLKSIARSLEALLVRLDRIEERLADFTKRCRTRKTSGEIRQPVQRHRGRLSGLAAAGVDVRLDGGDRPVRLRRAASPLPRYSQPRRREQDRDACS